MWKTHVIINTAIILKFLYKYSDSEKPFISPFAAIRVLIDISLQIDYELLFQFVYKP